MQIDQPLATFAQMGAILHGLYVITDENLIESENFLSIVESAIRGGATIVQLREKIKTQVK